MKKKRIKLITSILCLSLLSTSTVFASDGEPSIETVVDLSNEIMPAEIEEPDTITLNDDEPKSRVLTGKTLFSMNINGLSPGGLATTRSTGYGVKDSEITNFRFGAYNHIQRNVKIGLCTWDSSSGSYVDVGSVYTADLISTFTASFPYKTAYGFVKNQSLANISGNVQILELN